MFDLRIPKESLDAEILLHLYRFGYRVIGVTETFEAGKLKACDLNKQLYRNMVNETLENAINQPTPLAILNESPAKWEHNLQLFSRLHIVLDAKTLSVFSSNASSLSSYDIISVEPTTEKLFQNACTNLNDLDIISLNMATRLPFSLRFPVVLTALGRGIVFEICYSAALRDANARKHFLSNTVNLLRITKGKNVILSSGALSAMELRGPYDVMNLASLWTMSQNLAKDSLDKIPQYVINHALSRRDTYRTVIAMKPIQTPSKELKESKESKVEPLKGITIITQSKEDTLKRKQEQVPLEKESKVKLE